MAVTGWKKPTAAKNVGSGGTDWTNQGNILADDNTDATNAMAAGFSNQLTGYDFDFDQDIPFASTILGIEVRAEGWKSSGAGTTTLNRWFAFKDADAGSPTAITFVTPGDVLTGSRATYTGGGASTLPSGTWLDSHIRTTGFGVGIETTKSGTATAAFDWIEARIHYEPPPQAAWFLLA